MEELLSQLNVSDTVAIAIGVVLLIVGRKIFWMALGGLGFLLGLWLSAHVLDLDTGWTELALGLAAGLACCLLTFTVKKIALGIGGFVLGGAGALWLTSWLEVTRGDLGPWQLVIVLVGAVVGVALAPALFEASLVLFTSLAGALLIASRSHLGAPTETWLFLALVVVGLVLQSGGKKRRAKD